MNAARAISFDRALVVDDLAGSRDWLSRALALAFPGIRIDTATTLAEAARQIDPAPQLALVDLGLPDGSGIALIERLTRVAPETICIVATVFDDDAHLFPALRAGARGYVLKDQPPEALAELLRGITEGRPPLSASIARRLLGFFQPLPGEPEAALTARENEVLQLVAKGLTQQEASEVLGISRHTVNGYLKDIYRKLRVSNRAEATLEAARRGLVAT